MKKTVVDTNAFIRFFLGDIPKQKKAVEKLLKLAKNSKIVLIVPQIVIFEIQFILTKYYHLDKKDIIEKLHTLVSAKYLDVESRDTFLSALSLYKQNNISLADSFLLSKAKKEEAKLFTFDQRLKKLL